MTHTALNETGKLIAEAIVKAYAAAGIAARIEKTYLDYGQDWTWDTIIVKSKTGSYQALNPRQQEEMNSGEFDYSQINELVAFALKHS